MLHFATSFVYIIERYRMSDKTLTTVFTRLRNKFLNMALAILPSEDDAADALQDAFCKLWPRRDTINDEAETLKNFVINYLPIKYKKDIFAEIKKTQYEKCT